MRSVWLVLLAACTASPPADFHAVDGDAIDVAAPRAGLFHALDGVMVPGSEATFRVIGAVPGETVRIVRSFRGLGAGPCPDVIGGLCMDIRAPIAVLASGIADAEGEALIPFDVPDAAPIGGAMSTQAVVVRGIGGASSVLSPARTDTVRPEDPTLLAPTLVNLGTVPRDCDPAALVELRNAGLAPLTITGVRMTSDDFRVAGPDLPLVLGFDETVQVLVQADVRSALPYAGDLVIESDDPAGDAVVGLIAFGDDGAGVCPNVADEAVEAVNGSVDLTLLLDTTCSMGATADATADAFPGIAGDLASDLPDLTFGVATYDDYNEGGFGSGDDKPFLLGVQQTNDRDAAQAALDAIAIHFGGDGPEATHEGLYQTLTGAGYDQNCNGAYDDEDDVPPLFAGPDDAFGGALGEAYDPSVPGSGQVGGVGLRDGALHVIAYATDNLLRDPSIGDASPGGCAIDAGSVEVIDAANALGAKLVAVNSNSFSDLPVPQMALLADATGSVTDLDGDGVATPAVVTFDGDSGNLRRDLVDQIRALLPPDADFVGTLELVTVSDPAGLVASVEPAAIDGATYGESLDFTVTADGVWVPNDGPGVARVELALFHDGARLGGVTLYGVAPIE